MSPFFPFKIPVYGCGFFFFFQPTVCSFIEVHLQPHEGETKGMDRLAVLKMKLEKAGIACGSCKPGQYSNMICPKVVLVLK